MKVRELFYNQGQKIPKYENQVQTHKKFEKGLILSAQQNKLRLELV